MKTGKKVTGFSIALFLLFIAFTGYSQDKLIKRSKTIEKEYKETVKDIDVWNAFGNIEISRWDKPTLKVTVTVKVLAWDEDDAERFIGKISPEFKMENNETGRYSFSSTTSLSNIKNICNCKKDGIVYAPWFKKNAEVKKYSINYQIKLPSSVNNIYVANSFGNVTIPDFTGTLKMYLRNVNLKAGKLILNKDKSTINIRYGKATVESLENIEFCSYSCKEINIKSAINVKGNTRFSTINISDAKDFVITSKNDKISIDNLESLEGTGNFTDITVKHLYNSLKFYDKSGTIEIENIDPAFKTISLAGQYNDYILNLDKLNYILKADLEFTDFEGPESILSLEKREELISGANTFEKTIGKNADKSTVRLKCSNCNIELK
jgi:hypothetical protein